MYSKVTDPFRPVKPAAYGQPRSGATEEDVVEITRPTNFPSFSSRPPPPPLFSSQPQSGFGSFGQNQKNFVDLTKGPVAQPNIFDDNYDSFDPSNFMDSGQADENIKALLEGAFEDDDDKPRTRSRKKKQEADVNDLAAKLQGLGVDKEEEEEEEEEGDDGTVDGLGVKLLPHQIDGVEWMIGREVGMKKEDGTKPRAPKGGIPKGGILADDMGLGKTIQSISLILKNPRPSKSDESVDGKKKLSDTVGKGTLVVAPLALIKQWEAEIKEKVLDTHTMRVCLHHGPQRTKRAQDLKKYDVVITTYQILVSEHGSSSDEDDGVKVGCFGVHWYRVILDEAHTIKNRNAKATQAAYVLQSEYRWCLTGTPMQNNLDELQSLVRFLRIKPFDDIKEWKEKITRPMNQGRGGIAIKRLQYFLKTFMKRRTKDVLKKEGALQTGKTAGKGNNKSGGFQITQRKIEAVVAEFTPRERLFYERLEQRADRSLERMMMGDSKVSYASALVLLLRLRQACNHPELVSRSLAKDGDAISMGNGKSSATPKKAKPTQDDDLDDIANMLGGLTVESRKCDVCQVDLSKAEASSGAIRCEECELDLASTKPHKSKEEKRRRKAEKHEKERQKAREARKNKNRRVIVDSDDEEEAGEWLVPEGQQSKLKLGKAGGSDDENAEGGGEWLNSEDEESEDEDDRDEEQDSDEESSSSEDDDSVALKASVASAKIRHLMTVLKEEAPKNKFIVFSQFTSMLDLIEPFLKKAGLVYTRYDGSMRNDLREASLERLRNDKRTRILLCSLKCGSLGLNLTAASRVVILEPFWNPVNTFPELYIPLLSY